MRRRVRGGSEMESSSEDDSVSLGYLYPDFGFSSHSYHSQHSEEPN